MNNLALVNNIKNKCKENNVSISTLEQDLNLSPGLISRWTKNTPALDKVIEIANYFDISINDLVFNVNNDVAVTPLLLTLYNKTIGAEIEWQVYDPSKSEEKGIIQKIIPLVTKDTDCFYCNFNNGCFILTIQHDNEITETSLYVLADQYSIPVLKSLNDENLYKLRDYLLKRLSTPLNNIKTNNFIDDFINSAFTNNNNITFLRDVINK